MSDWKIAVGKEALKILRQVGIVALTELGKVALKYAKDCKAGKKEEVDPPESESAPA